MISFGSIFFQKKRERKTKPVFPSKVALFQHLVYYLSDNLPISSPHPTLTCKFHASKEL
jgi:hypothetical protein